MGEYKGIDYGLCGAFGVCGKRGLCAGLHQLESDARVNRVNVTNGGLLMSSANAMGFVERCIALGCQRAEELREFAKSDEFPA